MSAQASAFTICVHRFHPAGDYRSSFPVMKARRLAATTMAAPAEGQNPAFLWRAAFHLHRLKPVGRELCQPHCLAFKEDLRPVISCLPKASFIAHGATGAIGFGRWIGRNRTVMSGRLKVVIDFPVLLAGS